MRWILRSPAHRLVSHRAVLLGITGRRTGRRYEICVGYAPNGPDDIDVLVSDAANRSWWRNFTDGGPVEVTMRGTSYDAWATAHRAPGDEFKVIADRALPRILGRRGATTFFGVPDFDPETGLRREDLRRLDGFAVAVSIRRRPPAGTTPANAPETRSTT